MLNFADLFFFVLSYFLFFSYYLFSSLRTILARFGFCFSNIKCVDFDFSTSRLLDKHGQIRIQDKLKSKKSD